MTDSTSPPPRTPGSNIPELSVSDLALALKKTIEDSYGRVRVRGELSKVKIHTSGHLYTALKDANAVIDAVCWRGTSSRLKVQPEEGMEVICTGKLTTYPARSNYQLVIDQMELAGVGAILKMLEDRRKKLAAEGLFDADRKRPVPLLPQVVGVITSPTGAVIRDILHRIADRFPCTVLLWPVKVQGEGAADEIVAAIKGFNALPTAGFPRRPDVLIVARGGGSLEDLMPFNEESVVRAAAGSTIPLISAVGHETDTTLIDYASDLRAPTPTAAAEFVAPVLGDLHYTMKNFGLRLDQALTRRTQEGAHRLDALAARLGTPDRLFDLHVQNLDHTGERLSAVFTQRLERLRGRLVEAAARLRHPRQIVDEMGRLLALHGAALLRIGPRLTEQKEKTFESLSRLLETLSFTGVLKRGYAVVRNAAGHVVTDGKTLKENEEITLLMGDQIPVPARARPKQS